MVAPFANCLVVPALSASGMPLGPVQIESTVFRKSARLRKRIAA